MAATTGVWKTSQVSHYAATSHRKQLQNKSVPRHWSGKVYFEVSLLRLIMNYCRYCRGTANCRNKVKMSCVAFTPWTIRPIRDCFGGGGTKCVFCTRILRYVFILSFILLYNTIQSVLIYRALAQRPHLLPFDVNWSVLDGRVTVEHLHARFVMRKAKHH